MEEHRSMIDCTHDEADQLGPVCIHCGRLDLPDPSFLVVVAGLCLFIWNVYSWVNL